MQSSREKALVAKSLICLLESLQSKVTVIELRDDCLVHGVIRSVDSFMNVELSEVTLKRPVSILSDTYKEIKFDYFFVKGTRIRYVHIPDEVDPIEAIEEQLKKFGVVYEQRVANLRKEQRPRNYKIKNELSLSEPSPSSSTGSALLK